MAKVKNKISSSREDKIFNVIIHIIIATLLIIVAYPLIFVLSSSFSSKEAVTNGLVFLWPVDFSIEGYVTVFQKPDVLIGYRNTIIYTVVGTMLNLVLTMIAAYPLSRKDLPGGKFLTLIFTFTMIFNGGMIPTYMLVKGMGLMNSPLSMVILGGISAYNLIIARTFIQNSIPGELLEAARIDGCHEFRIFNTIVVPLMKPAVAVQAIFAFVGAWNNYFIPALVINSKMKKTIPILIAQLRSADYQKFDMGQVYIFICLAIIPLVIVYMFLSRSIIKGVSVGAVKE